MIGAINEFERTNMLERQREGIQVGKEKGVYKKKAVDMDKLRQLKTQVDKGLITVTKASKELGITRKTWYIYVAAL